MTAAEAPRAAAGLEVLPVRGIGEVTPGADLAELIGGAAPWLRDGDVLVVTSKIVSKAEDRLVEVPPPGPDRERARADAVAAETARTVAARGQTRIVATHHGFVMASAGVDASNVDSAHLVLLPKDPDASARSLRAALAARYGVRVGVVVSDTAGRPWRNGLTDLALGAAGVVPLRDHRGETDPYGNELSLTQVAVVDELAAAAELVKGKRDGIPVAVVRGYPAPPDVDTPGVVPALVRGPGEDMFPLGTAEARAAGLRAAAALSDAAGFGDGPVDPAAVRRAVAVVAAVAGRGTRMELVREPGAPAAIRCTAPDPGDPGDPGGPGGPGGPGDPGGPGGPGGPGDPGELVRLGADAHRLRAALAAEGLASTVAHPRPGTLLVLVGTEPPDPPGDRDR